MGGLGKPGELSGLPGSPDDTCCSLQESLLLHVRTLPHCLQDPVLTLNTALKALPPQWPLSNLVDWQSAPHPQQP